MIFFESIRAPIVGVFELRLWRGDELLEHEVGPNLVLTAMRESQARVLGGDTSRRISKFGVGTGAAAPLVGDAALTATYLRNILGVTHPTPEQLQIVWAIDYAEANGAALREFGLFTADGTLVARKVRGASIAKSAEFRLDGTWTLQL